MRENEAVKVLENHFQFLRESWKPYPDGKVLDALGMAISSMKEIQQYRSLGTVEECRAAVEKQSEKKPIYPYLKTLPTCPTCGEVNIQDESEYGNVGIGYDFCPDCGQKLDWSDSP